MHLRLLQLCNRRCRKTLLLFVVQFGCNRLFVAATVIGFQRRLIMSDRRRSRSPQISWRYYWSKTVAADGQHNWWKTWFPATPQWRLDADKMWSQASTTTDPTSTESQGSAAISGSPRKRKRSRTA